MGIHEQSTCFDEKELAAMIVAYDRTCSSLQPSGLTPTVREMIGTWIIAAAKHGERDPEVLHQKALSLWASKMQPAYLQRGSHTPPGLTL
ncbi:hypothetical protein [Rhodoplanes sp. Z2-YC6860]|uniref:hypothetical protein n=1 Tax=Rhodoplanes sp. Z2-YC6860 TaxID=674703 RepID=UPI0012EEC620|nr:hypothetical protein [Rhodoplanes sp. Z2-YC6860]